MLAQAYGYAGQKEKVLPLLEKARRTVDSSSMASGRRCR